MDCSARSPVLLIFFNRADCVERTLGAIRRARPSRLYLASDAPRLGVPDDAQRCAATQAAVERLVDWPCEVQRDYAPVNLGSDRRLSSAISWVFTHEECALIFEDDCVPDETFFPFCDELLERYANEPRIGMITGCQFVRSGWRCREGASYGFTRLTQIWGWATWRRAWKNFEHEMSAWPVERDRGLLRRVFRRRVDRAYWTKRFDDVQGGRAHVWDYRWAFARWRRDQIGIAPAQNLTSNIGFRPDAENTTLVTHPCAAVPTVPMRFPLRHPRKIKLDDALDHATAELLFSESSWWVYHRNKWRCRLRALLGRP